MNWKLLTGQFLHQAEQRLLKLNSQLVKKNYPFGRDWMFDCKRILNNADVIVDAGANVGDVSIGLNYWFPEADIFAFEPVKGTYNLLAQNIGGNAKIKPVEMGLGSANEKVSILLTSENTINSLKITEAHQDTTGAEEIAITRLDSYMHEHDVQHIDILKIDVEGFEFEVLNGCGSLINDAIKCIYLEVGYVREATKVHFSDVEQYMEKNGFELCGIYETRRNLYDKRRLWYSNNLYIKKSLLIN